ncbi:pectate lyase [Microbulbifer thermotolerans]|uniref:pectate lyase family protein n=1 Tax=Microbulbifer thermotolerans TaxID=252514 RepID=UPI00224B3E6A|nr:pectate lyase [Microbulbifer thermotolerans]MCX2783306.1 pectate lyase [Microbulbifer thermotolerans]
MKTYTKIPAVLGALFGGLMSVWTSAQDLGPNLALSGGADGSSKASGTSYGNAVDGNLQTYWQPRSSSGERISAKKFGGSFNTVIIREIGNAVQGWRLLNHDTGAELASGNGIGSAMQVYLGNVSMNKIDLMIDSATSAPRIAEFEIYNASGGSSSSSGSSSSGGSSSSSSSGGSSSSSSSSSSSGGSSSSSSGGISNACYTLATDPNVNWRDSSELDTDQKIVKCLSDTLGRALGYGENALGGYDPGGSSKLTVITKNDPQGRSVEQQILDAISGDTHNWIVFDKFDFAQETEIAMYRTHCGDASVQAAIDGTQAQCIDYRQWCAAKGYGSGQSCLDEFFNERLNDKNLPIRNPVIGSNKTIDGRLSKAYFRFSGFAIGKDSSGQPTQTAENVILTHLDFRGAGHTEDHGLDPDMIRSTGASHDIWIHKNTFDTTGDSAFDVKVGAYDITMSFNRLVNVKRATLHGSSDSRTINEQITTTMHHNAFVTTDDHYSTLGNTLRRVPLIRRGTSHMFNNLFMNYRKDVLSVRVGASVLWEDNAFLINRDHQEKSDPHAALDERSAQLARDVGGGNFRSEGSRVWFSDAQCNLDSAYVREITDASGSVGNLSQNYTQRSRDAIQAHWLPAGQDLVDYISATAGKGRRAPFNSPLAHDINYVVGLGEIPCQ